ncbi:MAG TPA: imidazole glycerol phosphate synthase subunit HisH [Planctomycetes bacterium]|nr:imidazole glycerol phosphate synthase subunit HisH [Planctomycetaceae bacterium]HIN95959.1 imidazole glycerol phosphate synthase subunit HisH [Planctomycetota bacterium]
MIAIIDYQMGNLRSVQKGFEKIGQEAQIVSDPQQLKAATKVVLPGVGAFGDAMQELTQRGFVDPLREWLEQDRPFLGICLGLQLLFDRSFEGGEHRGLGVLAGEVLRFDVPAPLKVPHMGWNELQLRKPAPILEGINSGDHLYFVHSYYVAPEDREVVAVEADYGGPFCAMVWRGQLFATQFHPEKSQQVGLQILENFSRLV